MPQPVILGVVGDSAAGKTTLTRGLVRLLGEENVTHVCTDDYHRYDRKQRAELNLTALHPDCNYVDMIAQHLAHLRNGEPILKPVYQHHDGTFGAPVYIRPARFAVVEGLLGYYTAAMRDVYHVRVFLSPPEELRRTWKVQRDCSRRGYTTDQVLAELDRREDDASEFIRPQERYSDIVVRYLPNRDGNSDQEHLDAELVLRSSLRHPDLSGLVGGDAGISMSERNNGEVLLHVAGSVAPETAAELEEEIWDRMHFASHLRTERLGEFTIGTDLHRSDSLAVIQVLILYHLLTARASLALGGAGTRSPATETVEA
ncbi:MAG: phosphoribulokinase [Thermoleophilia bacterium]|nr:phosphoribulokinase [Thermoleophilia bacterium]